MCHKSEINKKSNIEIKRQDSIPNRYPNHLVKVFFSLLEKRVKFFHLAVACASSCWKNIGKRFKSRHHFNLFENINYCGFETQQFFPTLCFETKVTSQGVLNNNFDQSVLRLFRLGYSNLVYDQLVQVKIKKVRLVISLTQDFQCSKNFGVLHAPSGDFNYFYLLKISFNF